MGITEEEMRKRIEEITERVVKLFEKLEKLGGGGESRRRE